MLLSSAYQAIAAHIPACFAQDFSQTQVNRDLAPGPWLTIVNLVDKNGHTYTRCTETLLYRAGPWTTMMAPRCNLKTRRVQAY